MNCLRTFISILLVFVFLKTWSMTPEAPRFDNASGEVSASGYFKLTWQWDGEISGKAYHFELQQADNKNFDNAISLYTGPDFATFISGLKNGDYYYRISVSLEDSNFRSEWSEPLLVTIKHHPLQLAYGLFAMGAVVFLATVGIVVRGSRSASGKN